MCGSHRQKEVLLTVRVHQVAYLSSKRLLAVGKWGPPIPDISLDIMWRHPCTWLFVEITKG